MSHYVCGECGGVSETPGTCQTEGCSMHGQELKACECVDGKHGMGMEEMPAEEEKKEEE